MVNGHRLQGFLDGFSDARVLCIGDVMLDRFIYGRVDRVSAEAPIQILHVGSNREMLGGVGNVARNVVALGAQAVLIAVTGDDQPASHVVELAESEHNLTAHLIVEPRRPSTVKTRYIAEGQQLLRADEETTAWISDDTAQSVMSVVRSELRRADVLVLSDYAKGVLTDDLLSQVIAEAREAGIPVIADSKRENFDAYAGVSILTPNLGELAAATGLPCGSDEEVEASAQAAMNAFGIETMMVTRSEHGMSVVRRGAKPLHLSAKALEVFDVSGAGDTVVATTAVALAAGADLEIAAELANTAGGIVVAKAGTAVVSREELAVGLPEAQSTSTTAKIMSAEMAMTAVDRWRKWGLKVGLTNGCFDLLHPGHVSLLTEAKASCDRLIVAMNGDKSVKRLKGEGRPVQSELSRAIVLASLSVVDMVVVFPEDTPVPLLELLKPDVLIKGGDYAIEEIVGAETVRDYGGEVKLAALVPGHSSSKVIARMSRPTPAPARGLRTGPSA